MKQILLLTFLLVIFTKSKGETIDINYVVSGTIKNAPDSSLVLMFIDNKVVDSIFLINEKFQFSGKIVEPTKTAISVKNYNGYKSFWLENEKISFDAEIKNLREAVVKGGHIQEDANILFDRMIPLLNKSDSLMHILFQENIEQHYYDSISNVREGFFDSLRQTTINFIREYPNSVVSLDMLNRMKKSYDKELLVELFALTSDESKQTKYGKEIIHFLAINKNPQVGDYYIDVELENLNNEKIKLSDIKAKYILLEFWASWCVPCRKENPNLVKTYSKYKDLGFKIYSISKDSDRESWKQAVEKDSLVWTNVCGLKGDKEDVFSIYNISSIPRNYLINEEGIIIARNLRGDKLEEKLKQLLVE